MRLPRLTLTIRVFLAVIAIVLTHFAFYAIPRCLATRPRFDEVAWNDAVSYLKEAIGPDAVDKGCFHIPQFSAYMPYEGSFLTYSYNLAGRNTARVLLSVQGDKAYLLFLLRPDESTRGLEHSAVAVLSRSQAQRIWFTFLFLSQPSCSDDRGIINNAKIDFDLSFFHDLTWGAPRFLARSGNCVRPARWREVTRPSQLDHLVSRMATELYVRRLYAQCALARNPALVRELLLSRIARTSVGPLPDMGYFWLMHGFRHDLAGDTALSLYRKVERKRLREGRSSKVPPFILKIPLIGLFFETSDIAWPDCRAEIWVLERLRKSSPENRVRAALDLAFAPVDPFPSEPKLSEAARLYALHCASARDRTQAARIIISELLAPAAGPMSVFDRPFAPMLRWEVLSWYSDFFSDDPSAARLAAAGPDKDAALRGLFQLYCLTRDIQHLQAICALLPQADSAHAVNAAASLGWCYVEYGVKEVPRLLSELYPTIKDPDVRAAILSQLLRIREPATVDFVFSAFKDPATFDEMFDPKTAKTPNSVSRSYAILSSYRPSSPDPRLTDIALSVFAKFPTPPGAPTYTHSGININYLYHLDERILPALEQIYAATRWSGRRDAARAAIDMINLRSAADPIAFISDPLQAVPNDRFALEAARFLADTCDEAKLRASLADDNVRKAWAIIARSLWYKHFRRFEQEARAQPES